MDLLVPEVISLILKLGAMMVLIKAGFMSLCHSLEERMALEQPANNVTTTCTGGIRHALSSCLLGCGTQDEAEDEAEVCVLFCQKRSTVNRQVARRARAGQTFPLGAVDGIWGLLMTARPVFAKCPQPSLSITPLPRPQEPAAAGGQKY